MARIPKAVEKAAQLAEDLHKQAYGKTDPSAPVEPVTEVTNPQNLDPATAADPSAPTDPVNATPAPTENADDKQKQKFPDADPNSQLWEQKYKVIANKYSAEIPRYASEVRTLKEDLLAKDAKIASLLAAQTQPAPMQKVSAGEIEEYGDKFYDFVKRAASEVVPTQSTDYEKLKESVEQVAKEQQQAARSQFFDQLAALAPQWETLNTDDGFMTWLGGIDTYTDRPRQELFDDAYHQLSARRVANFFNGFSGNEQKETEPTHVPPSMENQVVPTSNRTNSPPQAKKVWSTTEVAKFYDDVRRGLYKDADMNRIEQDIFAAQTDGRFR